VAAAAREVGLNVKGAEDRARGHVPHDKGGVREEVALSWWWVSEREFESHVAY